MRGCEGKCNLENGRLELVCLCGPKRRLTNPNICTTNGDTSCKFVIPKYIWSVEETKKMRTLLIYMNSKSYLTYYDDWNLVFIFVENNIIRMSLLLLLVSYREIPYQPCSGTGEPQKGTPGHKN